MAIGDHLKRLLGIGTRIKPITVESVSAAHTDPVVDQRLEVAKAELYAGLQSLEQQSVHVRKLLTSEALLTVARPGKRR